MALIIRLIIVLTLCVATPALAQDEFELSYDRFRLWNNCQPFRLIVEQLGDNATEIGLKKDTIETTVRSRLRAARIYTDNGFLYPYLYVNVNVIGAAFSVSFEYIKYLNDPISNEMFFGAVTWDLSTTGTHGMDSTYILGTISELIDKLIDEYLRVNADACP